MKRRSHKTEKKRANSPYVKYGKRPQDYSAMYRKVLTDEPTSAFAKHLRERRKMAD